jgi:hypothetical protein
MTRPTGDGRAGPDLVIVGRVATLAGPSGPGWAPGIAIEGGRVAGVTGGEGEARQVGAAARIWRLPVDLVVLPGITDAHLHLTDAALAATQLDLTGLDLDEALEAVREADKRLLAAADRDGWLLGHGWSLDALGSAPTAAMLDRVAPGRAVALWAHDHHSRWVSGPAMARAGIDGATADPLGGRVIRDDSGRPTGLLAEDAAGLVDGAIPPRDPAAVGAALHRYAGVLASLGVVGAQDPGEVVDDPAMVRGPRLYRSLADAGRLPLRVVGSVREEQLDGAIAAGFRTGRTDPSGRYRDGWLKLFADGSLGSRSAALLEPYEPGDPAGPPLGGPRGMALRSAGRLRELARRAASADIAVQIHGIGDAAVRTALDVLAGLPRVGGALHRVEHAQLVDPADHGRFAASGVAASVQPCHLLSDAPAARLAWGERTATAFPLRSLANAGALLAFGTDAPVEPPDPWPGIEAAVLRASPRWSGTGAFHPEQAMDRWAAMRAACRGPARSLGIDDEGHLGAGARADLIVVPAEGVDGDPRPGGPLGRTRPLATLIDGEVIHLAPGFEPDP